MMQAPAPSTPVKSALRTLDILELLAKQGGPMTAQEIAVTLGIPVSSLSYLLATLVERGYLERERRHYQLGPAIARLNRGSKARTLAERVDPMVRAMTRELNETAGFFVLRDFEIEAVARDIGQHALQYTIKVGQRAPLHAFAAGKAMLAAMPEEWLARYFRSVERKAFTPRTITDEPRLREALGEIRREGIARTREEHTPGIAGLGRAVIVDEVPIGAFSFAMPLTRLDAAKEQSAIRLLNRSAALLEGQLSAQQPAT